jgi:hypothetical protein
MSNQKRGLKQALLLGKLLLKRKNIQHKYAGKPGKNAGKPGEIAEQNGDNETLI